LELKVLRNVPLPWAGYDPFEGISIPLKWWRIALMLLLEAIPLNFDWVVTRVSPMTEPVPTRHLTSFVQCPSTCCSLGRFFPVFFLVSHHQKKFGSPISPIQRTFYIPLASHRPSAFRVFFLFGNSGTWALHDGEVAYLPSQALWVGSAPLFFLIPQQIFSTPRAHFTLGAPSLWLPLLTISGYLLCCLTVRQRCLP